MATVLVCAPHPDDETLGCGGTLLRHVAAGDQVHWLLLTNVDETFGWTTAQVAARQVEIERVSAAYGFSGHHKLNFPTTKLDTVPAGQLIQAVGDVIKQVVPEIVYVHNRSDVHSDHRVSFDAVVSSTKAFRQRSTRRVLMYETLSETEFAPALAERAFLPNVFIDVSDHFSRKMEIMEIYASELMAGPLPRSREAITALARLRGSRICVEYAEAFQLIFERI